ncbi:MAG: CDP-alcohol phosphatidyltransferase family protein, partial [Bacteroidota bacterium]
MLRQLLAWSVHLFTASGSVVGFLGLLAAIEKDWRTSLLYLLLCQFIDGIDGALARLAQVSEVLPKVKGKNIDYVIDFFTYVILPAYIFYGWADMPLIIKMIGASTILISS